MVSLGDLNFFGGLNFGIGTVASILLIMFLSLFILGLMAVAVILWLNNKKYKHKIPLLKKVGKNTIRVGTFKAKDFKIGTAGDKLWYVAKVKKFITPATEQTAPNEYTHFERSDGEWVNVSHPDIDEALKKINVKYVHQDMRATRIAISNLLDQRFQDKKSWWDKYGDMVTHLIFYLVTIMFLVIGFYQWSEVIGKIAGLFDRIIEYEKNCKGTSLVPSLILLMYKRKREGQE